jgi:hypothetical protein
LVEIGEDPVAHIFLPNLLPWVFGGDQIWPLDLRSLALPAAVE